MKNEKKSLKTKLLYSVAMLAVSAVVLTTASYAWFSMSNQPKVEDITLKAGTYGSLSICKTRDGVFGDTVDLSSDILAATTLRPITSPNGYDFYKPTYGDAGKVTGVEATKVADIAAISNKSQADGGYIAKSTFYLKASGASAATAKIQLSNISRVTNEAAGEAAYSIRVAFVLNDTTTCKVYEPNANASSSTADDSQYKMAGYDSLTTIKQNQDGKFSLDGSTYVSDVSPELFSIPVDTPSKVDVYIWIEGADKDCVNNIAAKTLKTVLQFTSTDI